MAEVERLRALQAELATCRPIRRCARERRSTQRWRSSSRRARPQRRPRAEPGPVPFRPRPGATPGISGSPLRSSRSPGSASWSPRPTWAVTTTTSRADVAERSARGELGPPRRPRPTRRVRRGRRGRQRGARPRARPAGRGRSEPAARMLGDETAAEETAESCGRRRWPRLRPAAHRRSGRTPIGIAVPADFDPDAPILERIALGVYGVVSARAIERRNARRRPPRRVCTRRTTTSSTPPPYVFDGDDRSRVHRGRRVRRRFVVGARRRHAAPSCAMGPLF